MFLMSNTYNLIKENVADLYFYNSSKTLYLCLCRVKVNTNQFILCLLCALFDFYYVHR